VFKISRIQRFVFIAAVLAIFAILASAQSFVGGVRGLVQDPGGAVIAGANVTLRNEANGSVRTTATNAQGEYVFSQVEPATYTLVVERRASRSWSAAALSSARSNNSISTSDWNSAR
jgi:hypothetical protein